MIDDEDYDVDDICHNYNARTNTQSNKKGIYYCTQRQTWLILHCHIILINVELLNMYNMVD